MDERLSPDNGGLCVQLIPHCGAKNELISCNWRIKWRLAHLEALCSSQEESIGWPQCCKELVSIELLGLQSVLSGGIRQPMCSGAI